MSDQTVTISQAKTHLSRLVERAATGEEIVITRRGRPTARLVPLAHAERRRAFGRMRGKIYIADDFNAPLPARIVDGFG